MGPRNKRSSIIAIIMLSTILLPSCAPHAPSRKPRPETSTATGKAQPMGSTRDQVNKPRPQQQASGPVSAFPWDKDPNFLQARLNEQTSVLMAGYRTVLSDPLPGEEYNVHLAARLLAGTVVKPGNIFSQNAAIGPYSQSKGFREGPTYVGTQLFKTTGGGVCKMASTLYNAAVLSDLPVVERHAHSMPVPYVPYGQDATVSYGAKDLKFFNNTPDPILIWAAGVGNELYVGFYGRAKPPQVEWHHQLVSRERASTIYRPNYSLPRGTDKVISTGMDGALVRSWVTIMESGGQTQNKQLGNSYYHPLPHIVERGAASPAWSQPGPTTR